MAKKSYDYFFKLLLIGGPDVAKAFISLHGIHPSYISTIGVDFSIRIVDIDGKKIKLQICDTTGVERSRTVITACYRRTKGIMLVFNINDRTSFDHLSWWIYEIRENVDDHVKILLVGHICDLESDRQVSYDEGKQFAETNGIQYIELCAKTGHNVDEAFELLTKQILNRKEDFELHEIEKVPNTQSSNHSHHSFSHENPAAVATMKAFQLAMRDGIAKSNFFPLCVFGPENSGKTCLIATLFGETFQQNEATQGADVHIGTIFVSNWSKMSTKQIANKLETKFYHGLNITAKDISLSSSSQVPSTTSHHGLASKLKAVFLRSTSQEPHKALEMQKIPTIKVEDIKQAKASKSFDEDEFTAIVWDFAGQIQYLSTHTVFIRKNNTVLIVFKASCDLLSFIKAKPGEESSGPTLTYFAVIHYWLQSLSSICHGCGGADHMSEFLPTAVLVATHIDEINENLEEAKEVIIIQLARELKGKPYAKHLVGNLPGVGLLNALRRYCIFLSNKTRDAHTISKLKKIILQVSMPTMEEKYPLIYLKIENKLILLKKEVITTTEFCKIAVENGFIAEENSKEMKGALEYFHQKGVILHFPSIENLVFLSPQWLEKLVAYLIIAHHYKPRGDEDDYSYNRLKYEGVLLGSFLSHMLQMFNKEQRSVGCEISFSQAIAFLVKFGFIVEIDITTEFLEETHPLGKDEERVFIVPSQLPECSGENRISFLKDKNVWSIHFVFTNGFIPLMIFHHMVSNCIKWNVCRNQSIAWLRKYEIMMVLDHGQYYSVSLCKEKSSIQLNIILERQIQPSGGIRQHLIDYFRTILEHTCEVFMPASAKPVAYIPCPHCDELHIKYERLIKKRPVLCKMISIPANYYQDLFQETKDISKQFGGKDRVNVPDLLQYLRPVTKWQNVGVHLLPVEEIKIIYANHKDDVEACQFELFTRYLQMGDMSWHTVIAALRKGGYKNLAKDIKEKLDL